MNAEEIADAVMGPPSGREAEAAPERIEGERAARSRLDNDGPITEKYSVRAALGIFSSPGMALGCDAAAYIWRRFWRTP